jgi:hypothetical protein
MVEERRQTISLPKVGQWTLVKINLTEVFRYFHPFILPVADIHLTLHNHAAQSFAEDCFLPMHLSYFSQLKLIKRVSAL